MQNKIFIQVDFFLGNAKLKLLWQIKIQQKH